MNFTEKVMRALADAIKSAIPLNFGFVLLVFPCYGPGTANYISNCDRECMIKVLREKADILEQGGDIKTETNAKIN